MNLRLATPIKGDELLPTSFYCFNRWAKVGHNGPFKRFFRVIPLSKMAVFSLFFSLFATREGHAIQKMWPTAHPALPPACPPAQDSTHTSNDKPARTPAVRLKT